MSPIEQTVILLIMNVKTLKTDDIVFIGYNVLDVTLTDNFQCLSQCVGTDNITYAIFSISQSVDTDNIAHIIFSIRFSLLILTISLT